MPRTSSNWSWIGIAIVTLSAASLCAHEPVAIPDFPRTPPVPPDAAEATFEVLHGFRMQLIASEPLVADPVDMAYDEAGRAYVVEMRDYPYPEEKGARPTEFLGQIRLVEDADGDGIFDRSEVFADQLSWPTSVVCWKGGVFVTAAPDLWYFKDSDGDRKADIKQQVFSGFGRDNVQAIVNGLRWGLDRSIYGAASGNGGSVTPANGNGDPINVNRRDFRFDPATFQFQAISGGARFGHSLDDWGNRFVCNIRNPVQHVVLPSHYLSRNPLLAAPNPVHDVAESGDQLPVYRISPPEAWRVFRAQRWAAERVNYPRSELIGAGYWTSSSGVTIYRGNAYPAEFEGSVWIGEVAGNLVHRQQLEVVGPTFTSRRADKDVEFVASRDPWFRPVNFVNAPDGTLHVLDMYRETIEHPWSIPEDIKAKLDLRSGNDLGRIYRLAPPGFKVPPPPRLGNAPTDDLVAQLENFNAWWRETAQRLLYERQDRAAVPLLKQLLATSSFPQARLHSMYALSGLGALDEQDLQAAMADRHEQVRRHGLILAEPHFANSRELRRRVIELSDDPSPIVRFQVAFALGELPATDSVGVDEALARIARRDAENPWIRTAVLSSAKRPFAILDTLIKTTSGDISSGKLEIIRELARYAGAAPMHAGQTFEDLFSERMPQDAVLFAVLTGYAAGSRFGNRAASSGKDGAVSKVRLASMVERAATVINDPSAAIELRVSAIELLEISQSSDALASLTSVLHARESSRLQLAAIRVLAKRSEPAVAKLLVDQWRACSSVARQEIVETLLSRPAWAATLLDALERDQIAAGQLTTAQRGRLVGHPMPEVQKRSLRLLGPAAATARHEVIARYREALKLSSDLGRGRTIFERECAPCHRFGRLGHDVGPNLNTIRHRSPDEILIHLFDPNREVAPQFVSHSVQLRDGRLMTGMIASESETSLELRRAENARDVVLRSEIEDLTSSNKSLMAEGFEQKLNFQDTADLLAFLLKG